MEQEMHVSTTRVYKTRTFKIRRERSGKFWNMETFRRRQCQGDCQNRKGNDQRIFRSHWPLTYRLSMVSIVLFTETVG